MAKKEEEKYTLTLKGLLATMVDLDKADEICKEMELHAYRTGLNKDGIAIVLEDKHWVFRGVERAE